MGDRCDIFVISDLHLGDGGPRDNFEIDGKPRQLRAFIDHVGEEGGELFILGDLFEFWQMNISGLLVNRQELIEHLLAVPLTYVPGNHDVDLLHFVDTPFVRHPLFTRMRLPFERELGGRRFRFAHGHESDPFNNSDDPGFGRMLAIFAGVFEDRNRSPLLTSGETVEAVLEQFGESMLALWSSAVLTMGGGAGADDVHADQSLTPAQNPDRLKQHLEGIQVDRERGGYDVAVVGHTHRPGRIGDWYHNSGSWAGQRNTFLRIDPEGHVRHLEWKEGRAVEYAPVQLRGEEPKKDPIRSAAESVKALFPRPTPPERSRLLMLLEGVLACALGIYAAWLLTTQGWGTALDLLVVAFGAYGIVVGAIRLIGSRREHLIKRLLDRLQGAVSVLLGLVILIRASTPEVFIVLLGTWALLMGLLRFAASMMFRRVVDWRWLRIEGALGAAGGLALLLIPITTKLMTWAIAAVLLTYGLAEILGGIFGRRRGLGKIRASRRWRARPAPA